MENYNTLTQEGKEQIISIIIDELEHNCLPDESIIDRYGSINDLHSKLFNEDYFITGYYQASQWLLKYWTNDTFDVIDTVKTYEMDHFGEFNTPITSESICNMLVYIIGEEVLYSIDEDEDVNSVIKQLLNL